MVRFYGVTHDQLSEAAELFLDRLGRRRVRERRGVTAVELFLDRRDAERVVEDWDRDEPAQAGLLSVEVIELEMTPN